MSNNYDKLEINIGSLISAQDKEPAIYNPKATSEGNALFDFFRFYGMAFLIKSGIWRRMIYSHVCLGWFDNFREYWVKELGGRPIEPHDFYYLFGEYRKKFQDLGVEDGATESEFLEAWQNPKNIYSVFSYVYKYALMPLRTYRINKFIPKNAKVCEYGCGIAPVAQSLIRYSPHKNLRIHCADISAFTFHYARWNLRKYDFVKFIKINPQDKAPLSEKYDVIIVLAVLEHLPNPLEIIKHLHEKLEPNGVLIFDYINSEGTGLDTKESKEQRLETLKFIKNNFQILEGKIYLNGKDIKIAVTKKI